MQLQYPITNLSEYSKKVEQGKWNFPNFSDKCPICGEKDCAVRIGYYWRWDFCLKVKRKIYIPIARYLCRRKNKNKSQWTCSHRTFSLLPSQCIPYKLYDVDSAMFMADYRFNKDMPIVDIAYEFSTNAEPEIVLLSPSTVFEYLLSFAITHTKLLSLLKFNFDTFSQTVDHIKNHTGGPVAFAEHIYQKYAFFLFGTPSQLR